MRVVFGRFLKITILRSAVCARAPTCPPKRVFGPWLLGRKRCWLEEIRHVCQIWGGSSSYKWIDLTIVVGAIFQFIGVISPWLYPVTTPAGDITRVYHSHMRLHPSSWGLFHLISPWRLYPWPLGSRCWGGAADSAGGDSTGPATARASVQWGPEASVASGMALRGRRNPAPPKGWLKPYK